MKWVNTIDARQRRDGSAVPDSAVAVDTAQVAGGRLAAADADAPRCAAAGIAPRRPAGAVIAADGRGDVVADMRLRAVHAAAGHVGQLPAFVAAVAELDVFDWHVVAAGGAATVGECGAGGQSAAPVTGIVAVVELEAVGPEVVAVAAVVEHAWGPDSDIVIEVGPFHSPPVMQFEIVYVPDFAHQYQ